MNRDKVLRRFIKYMNKDRCLRKDLKRIACNCKNQECRRGFRSLLYAPNDLKEIGEMNG